MYKFFLLLITILIIPIVSAEVYTAGHPISLYTIEKCEGPVNIKINTELEYNSDYIDVERCQQLTNNTWKCDCDNNFNVTVLTDNRTKNIYDFVIQYYIEYTNYQNDNRTPNLNQIEFENNQRTHRIIDVEIIPPEKPTLSFDFDVKTKNAILFSILFVVFVVMIVLFKVRKVSNKSKQGDDDIFNYSVKNEEEEVDDILNKIK